MFQEFLTACACGTTPRCGLSAAMPGKDQWRYALGDGVHCRHVARYSAFNDQIFAGSTFE
jgi:hypothetical protein